MNAPAADGMLAGMSDFERRWRALRRRDRGAVGTFVYAVKTTGVFCRPGCASRLPLRQNVEFFAGAAEAERAGYRACKRCAPAGVASAGSAANAANAADDGQPIVRACRLLEGDGAARTEDVARAVGLSVSHFARAFKRRLGVTPQAYRRRVLAERAKRELARSATVTTAVYAAGYSSASRFYGGAGSELGMAPREAQRGAAGKHVQYVVHRCTLGRLLIAWTERGACEVALGDREGELVAALRARFPRAACARSAAPAWIGSLLTAIEQPRSRADVAREIPLDIAGTAFQQRVWQALRRIPIGETRSYRELARALGSASLTRAVARACASNRVAVLVPCHRVVRADGTLSGYRWDPERKRALLAREAGGSSVSTDGTCSGSATRSNM